MPVKPIQSSVQLDARDDMDPELEEESDAPITPTPLQSSKDSSGLLKPKIKKSSNLNTPPVEMSQKRNNAT